MNVFWAFYEGVRRQVNLDKQAGGRSTACRGASNTTPIDSERKWNGAVQLHRLVGIDNFVSEGREMTKIDERHNRKYGSGTSRNLQKLAAGGARTSQAHCAQRLIRVANFKAHQQPLHKGAGGLRRVVNEEDAGISPLARSAEQIRAPLRAAPRGLTFWQGNLPFFAA